jgi:hypothetical protein
MSDESKIYLTLRGSRDLTLREVSGGSGVSFDRVNLILDVLVANGAVVKTGTLNTARYNLVGEPAPVVIEVKPYVNPDVAWNQEAQERERKNQQAAMPPAPPLRRDLTDAQLDEIIAAENARKLTITLTPEEQAQANLMHKNRRGIRNPNAFVVKS